MADLPSPGPKDMEPLRRAFNQLVMLLPSDEVEGLLRTISNQEAATPNAPSAAVLDGPGPRLHLMEEVITAMNNEPRRSDLVAVNTRMPRGRRADSRKLRPLNSFIAFRSYYSGTLTGMTQKAKSGILRFLWHNDPFKAKWAILAKAYSSIRDKHENGVTLDTFLALTIPFIGLIEPSKYLQTMGWKVVKGQDFQYHVVKGETVTSGLPSVSTNVSVTDVINYCYASGYVEGNHSVQEPVAGQGMPFAAQPTPNTSNDDKTTSDVVSQAATVSASERTIANLHSSFEWSFEVHDDLPNHSAFVTGAQEAIEGLAETNDDDDGLFASFNPQIEGLPVFDPIDQSGTYSVDLTGLEL